VIEVQLLVKYGARKANGRIDSILEEDVFVL